MSALRTEARPTFGAHVLMLPIRGWRLVSRWLPPRCRFFPSCSAYAIEALELHGAARGSWLAVKRVGRCHPWHVGGVDPVPGSPSAPEANIRSLRGPTVRRAQTG